MTELPELDTEHALCRLSASRCALLKTMLTVFGHPYITPEDLMFPATEESKRFGPTHPDALRAKQVCGRCEIRCECGEYAIAAVEQFGIWGGLTWSERRAVIRSRGNQARRARRTIDR